MKKRLRFKFSLSVILLIPLLGFAQCPPNGGVTLSTQQDVIDFAVQYPNCTGFNNILTIQGADIVDLSPLSQLTFLEALWIFDTSLSSLSGLDQLVEVYGVDLIDNDQLVDISAFQNLSFLSSIRFEENNMLSECNVLSVCQLLIDDGFSTIVNNAVGCNNEEEIIASCLGEFNTVVGKVCYDHNNNGCSNVDYFAENILMEVSNGTEQIITNTNGNGDYRTIFDWQGDVTARVIPESLPDYFVATPLSTTVNFVGVGNVEQADFCLTATETISDVKVVIFPMNAARPGFNSRYKIIYENKGTVLVDGSIELNYADPVRHTFLDAVPMADVVNSNTIIWNYTNLVPNRPKEILVEFANEPPPTNDEGDVLIFDVIIQPTNDNFPDDNTYTLEQILVNSQDPNDKIVLQGSEIEVTEVGNYLDYVIRFQNIGTADAIYVRVEDELSSLLDVYSLRVLDASHNYRLEILNENELSFIFENINLPPENTHPEESNGYVAFQIKTMETLEVGDEINNEANIFFDFNAPILTNTVTTTVIDDLGVLETELLSNIKLFPNPVTERLQIETKQGIEISTITLYSLTGKEVLVAKDTVISTSKLPSGVYFVIVETNKGPFVSKIIKV